GATTDRDAATMPQQLVRRAIPSAAVFAVFSQSETPRETAKRGRGNADRRRRLCRISGRILQKLLGAAPRSRYKQQYQPPCSTLPCGPAVSDIINNDLLRCDHGMSRPAIVQSLLSDVIGGRLRAGDHLVTQGLADRFGVSHTPVREALMTLAGLGLVELQPNRGAVVRRVSADEVREVCQVRRALECEAVRRACGRIDPVALAPLAD